MKANNELRRVELTRHFTKYAAGSVLIKWGDTWVLCTASIEEKVPPFLRNTERGWVTAEYSMLPGSTKERKEREVKKLKADARGSEISRLVGRALRAAVDMEKLGERTITVDCDVLQADGGTRCASITGGMVALADAISSLLNSGVITQNPLKRFVTAVSAGICNGQAVLDLDYAHDSSAEVDMNFVLSDDGRFIEIQGTAEREPFTDEQFETLKSLAKKGAAQLCAIQKRALQQ